MRDYSSGTRPRLVVALLIGIVPLVTSAQTLRGKAVQPSDGAGIAGALVLLIDSAGNVAARGLTNERGEYRVTAPAAGPYRVRALRIGYHPAIVAAVKLRAGVELEQQLELTSLPITLDTVRVLARARCSAYDGASTIASAWEQARTALSAADLTPRDAFLHATVMRVQLTLDPRTGRVRQASSTESSGFVTKPWGTLPPDSLRRFGYVYRLADGSTIYYAPDIEALLSENFVQDHCFRFASGRDSALLGVAFEPTRDRRDLPEIAGTVWLDRKSAELRRTEFSYVNVKGPVADFTTGPSAAGGAIHFVRMMNGGWAISNWEIRIPVLGERARPRRSGYDESTEIFIQELRLERGVLMLVTRAQDTLWRFK